MATKTMKIGLSNADKNTMSSQVALETINKLIDAYSTSKQYSVGDYVNNAGIIYVCTEATSGAWDSTKWSVATLNQVIDKINQAANSVENKAEKDGYYETFGYAREAGIAKNLQNDEGKLLDPDVDTSSGTTYADAPFVQRATAMTMKAYLDNELITVGSGYEQWRKEQAFSIVRNNKVVNGNFDTITNWNQFKSTVTVDNNTAKMVATEKGGSIFQDFNLINSHKYLICARIKLTTPTSDVNLYLQPREVGGSQYVSSASNTNWQTLSWIGVGQGSNTDTWVLRLQIQDNRTSDWDTIQIKNVVLIDLTQWFASKPEIAEALNGDAGIKWFLQNYPQALSLDYDTGTIVDTEDYVYETTGVNLWDEEWELGSIDQTTGQNEIATNQIRSKNYISVISGYTYYFKTPQTMGLRYYDINKNYIGSSDVYNDTRTMPDNCAYVRFICLNITTYNNDIQICNHFTETLVEQTYHKYEIFKDRISWAFTSTGKGKSAGNVADTKDYVNFKNIEKVGQVDLEDIVFTWDGTRWYANASSLGIKLPSSNDNKANLTSSKYSVYAINAMATDSSKIGIGVATNGNIYVYNNDSTNQPNGILNYELATYNETDMVGDELDTNIPENDYGVERKVSVSGNMFSGSATTIFYQDNVLRQIYNNKGSIDNLQEGLNTIEARIPIAPTTDGTYTLKAVVSNGVATYSWTLDSQGE